MESWIRGIFLGGSATLLLATSAAATAAEPSEQGQKEEQEQIIQPQVERRDIKHVGIDTGNFEAGAFAGLLNVEDFGTNLVYGARLGYHVTEDIFVESTYGRSETSETSFERLSGNIQLLQDNDRKLQYYNIDFGLNILPGESFFGNKLVFTSSLYLIGGIGGTRFGGNDAFTWNVGMGYRALVNDWISLRLDVRDHVFDVDLLGENQTNNNIEVSGGISYLF